MSATLPASNMDDPKRVVSPQPEKEESPATVTPAVEPKTLPEEVAPAEKPVETPTPEGEPETLPEEPTDQAKAFQSQRQEIKRLKEQLEDKKRRESAFSQFKTSYSPTEYQKAETQVDINNYVDPNSGQFQAYAYNQAVNKIIDGNRRQSNQTAANTARETYDELRMKDKYPETDPESEAFDPDFEEAVARRYYWELANGKTSSLVKLADMEAKLRGKEAKKVAEKAGLQEAEKEQASLGPNVRSKPGFANLEKLEALRKRTRFGDEDAIVERMRNIKS